MAFGQIAEITGKQSWKFPAVQTTADLKQKLELEFPALKAINYSIAVNRKITRDEASLQHEDVVALLPPFSGG